MKKLRCYLRTVLLIAIGLSWFSGAMAGLNDGLVAYYPFDGNANDESGNGNDGTVHGATLTEDKFGNAKSAYSFNGINDFIEVPNSNKLNFGSGPFSILLWAKTNYKTGASSLISKGAGFDDHHDAGWGISYANTPQSLYLLVGDGSSHIEYNSGYHSFVEWTQIGMIRESNGEVFMVAYGLKIFTGKTFLGDTTNNISITMGKNNIYSGYLQGSIDDVRVYNRALSDSEIQQLYQMNNQPEPPLDNCWAIYENGNLHIPCIKVKGPSGEEWHYEADMQYEPLSEPMTFQVTRAKPK